MISSLKEEAYTISNKLKAQYIVDIKERKREIEDILTYFRTLRKETLIDITNKDADFIENNLNIQSIFPSLSIDNEEEVDASQFNKELEVFNSWVQNYNEKAEQKIQEAETYYKEYIEKYGSL